ncbi:MAG: hemerythrin domain-containing protein [Acidobacteriaceae bacterium]
MGVQIGAKLDSGFDDPIGMLVDCHRRIEHFLNVLCVVAQRAGGRSLSDEEAAAVRAAQGYFHEGGKRHTADEEQSLFSRLVGMPAASLAEELGGLEGDHKAADGLHHVIDWLYLRWIADGSLTDEEQVLLLRSTDGLRRLYSEHIKIEEQIVFPRAAALLDGATIEVIGQEFRRRRAKDTEARRFS